MFLTFWLANVLLATAACTFDAGKRQKVPGRWSVLLILTCKCASRYSGVPFFDIWTSKSARLSILTWNVLRATAACHFSTAQLPKVLRNGCFWAFWLGMRFAPQRRTIFPQPNLQKCSGMDVFEHFDLECASRHGGVQFFLSALSSHLRTRRFSEPTFRPSRHTNHWKNTAFRDFPNISRHWIFSLRTFAQLYLLSSGSTSRLCFFICWLHFSALLFQLSILSEVGLLNFLWLFSYSTILYSAISFVYRKFLN